MERFVMREPRDLPPQHQMRLFLGPDPAPRTHLPPLITPPASRFQNENTLYLDRADYRDQTSSLYPQLHMTNEESARICERPTNMQLMYAPTTSQMERPMLRGGDYQRYGNSGIDPAYLANYQTNNTYIPVPAPAMAQQPNPRQFRGLPQQHAAIGTEYEIKREVLPERKPFRPRPHVAFNTTYAGASGGAVVPAFKPQAAITEKATNKDGGNTVFASKAEPATQPTSRADVQKELFKDGLRVFSGPVEKIIKWHKVLQDIGAMCFFEVVAKVVSVRQGEGCAKHVLVRDEGGPVLQIVYYEVDFLLPTLQPHCTIRVVGKMAPGAACRLQAYSVRRATGDDAAALPRRAAVAAHQLAKMKRHFAIA